MYQVFYFYYFYNILLNEKMNCPYYKSSSFFLARYVSVSFL